jgi:hypothetical protein
MSSSKDKTPNGPKERSTRLSEIFEDMSRYEALDEIVIWLVARHKLSDVLEALAHAARAGKH